MIRVPVTLEELQEQIEQEAPGWLERARRRTEGFRALGRYEESSPIWSEVKKVYMRLQHDKCAYCERCLASEDHGGTIEHDLEHYRPKGEVKRWPPHGAAETRRIAYDFETGEGFPTGYFLLAYHPFNYATACKKCNSPLKGSFFPVAGTRDPQGENPMALRAEVPFLPYPIGNLDEDPEEVIGFLGIVPVPRAAAGPTHLRAVVTIDFFELDERDELLRGRARVIEGLYNALESARSGSAYARSSVENLTAPSAEHASCARSFVDLYRRDPERARQFAEVAQDYLKSLKLKRLP